MTSDQLKELQAATILTNPNAKSVLPDKNGQDEGLFHGSAVKIEGRLLKPGQRRSHFLAELGVYATPMKPFAAIYMLPTDADWTDHGLVDGRPYVLTADRDRYEGSDNGGFIYHVPRDLFAADAYNAPHILLAGAQVPIIDTEQYPSGLTALHNFGVTLIHSCPQEFRALTSQAGQSLLLTKIRAVRLAERKNQRLPIPFASKSSGIKNRDFLIQPLPPSRVRTSMLCPEI